MKAAKVVNTTEQENGIGDGLLSTSQAMGAAHQRGEVSAERAIEPFNEGRVDRALPLSSGTQAGEHGTRARQHIPGQLKGAAGLVFDDLSQCQTRPDTLDSPAPQSW